MIHRALIPPTLPMARRLARLDPVTRQSPGLAAAALRGDYLAEDIAAHLSEAMAMARGIAEALASERPWALALGCVRDLASIAVLVGLGTAAAFGWAVLS